MTNKLINKKSISDILFPASIIAEKYIRNRKGIKKNKYFLFLSLKKIGTRKKEKNENL